MIYLVDASVIITAKDYYYQIDRVPEFWEWLSYWGEQGKIRIPKEIMFEITQDSGILGKWIKERKNLFLIDEEIQNVNYVLMNGYDLTLDEIDDIQNRESREGSFSDQLWPDRQRKSCRRLDRIVETIKTEIQQEDS